VSEAFVTRCPTCGIDWELDEGNIPFAFQCKGCDHYYGINWHPEKKGMLRITDINTYKQYEGYSPRRKAGKGSS